MCYFTLVNYIRFLLYHVYFVFLPVYPSIFFQYNKATPPTSTHGRNSYTRGGLRPILTNVAGRDTQHRGGRNYSFFNVPSQPSKRQWDERSKNGNNRQTLSLWYLQEQFDRLPGAHWVYQPKRASPSYWVRRHGLQNSTMYMLLV